LFEPTGSRRDAASDQWVDELTDLAVGTTIVANLVNNALKLSSTCPDIG
jgi:hypothetical protein